MAIGGHHHGRLLRRLHRRGPVRGLAGAAAARRAASGPPSCRPWPRWPGCSSSGSSASRSWGSRGAPCATPSTSARSGVVDSASGMVVSVLAFLLCAWMVLSVAASSSLGPTSEQVRASRGFPLLDQVLAGPGGALLDDARELLATIDVPSLPFNPATLPPVEDPVERRDLEGGRAGGPGLGGPGVDHLDPLRVLVAGLGGRGQPRSGGHERPRRGRCRSDHRRLRERPRHPRGTPGLPRPGERHRDPARPRARVAGAAVGRRGSSGYRRRGGRIPGWRAVDPGRGAGPRADPGRRRPGLGQS